MHVILLTYDFYEDNRKFNWAETIAVLHESMTDVEALKFNVLKYYLKTKYEKILEKDYGIENVRLHLVHIPGDICSASGQENIIEQFIARMETLCDIQLPKIKE